MEQDTPKNRRQTWLIVAGIALIIIAVILLIWYFLQGQTTVTGNWHEAETSQSLTCKANGVKYEFFDERSSTKNDMQITAIFNNGISSISLISKSYYDDTKTAQRFSDENETKMNQSFGGNGLKQYALNASYVVNDTMAQMSLYTTKNDLNYTTSKYFLIKNPSGDISDYQKEYEQLGFKCETLTSKK